MRSAALWFGLLRSGMHFRDKLNIATYAATLVLTKPFSYSKKLSFLRQDILVRNEDGAFLCRKGTTDLMMSSLFYEKSLREFMKIEKGTFIDVGAHIGRHTITAARKLAGSGTVLAIEPEKNNFAALEKNIALNGLKNVHSFNVACGARNYRTKFYINECDGLHSLKNKTATWVNVDVKSLDYLMSKIKAPPVGMIKIDAEGAEPDVLAGAIKTIKRDKPKIVFESSSPKHLEACRTIFAKLKYRVTKIGDKYDDFYYLALPESN